jgi:hypothetical protein
MVETLGECWVRRHHPEISKRLASYGNVPNQWDQPLAFLMSSYGLNPARTQIVLFGLKHWRKHGIWFWWVVEGLGDRRV